MKRGILVIIVLSMVLWVTGCEAKNKKEESSKKDDVAIDISIQELLEINTTREIVEKGHSIFVEWTSDIEGMEDFKAYVDNEILALDYNHTKSVFTAGEQCQRDSNGFHRYFNVSGVDFKNEQRQHYLINEDSLKQVVVSSEMLANHIHIKTVLSTEDSLEALEVALPEEIGEEDYLSYEYWINPDSKYIEELKMYINREEGKKEEVYTAKVSYDNSVPSYIFEMIELAEELDVDTSDKVCKITVILNPGTDREQSFEKSIEKGNRLIIETKENYGLFVDEECTESYLGDFTFIEDTIIYSK